MPVDTAGAAPRTARAVARAELTRAILASAGGQLAEVGPAALSLRAVARDLQMASSAVYRYFPSRDALLTALIVEAYDALGAAMEDAEARAPRSDLPRRWRAGAGALRTWATAHPHQYALTYGSPVPGYAAPRDTVTPALRPPLVLLGVARDAQVSGLAPAAGVSAQEQASLAPVLALLDPPLSPAWGLRALAAWSTLLGHLSLELFGHLHRGVLDYEAHWASVVDLLAADLGLDSGAAS